MKNIGWFDIEKYREKKKYEFKRYIIYSFTIFTFITLIIFLCT